MQYLLGTPIPIDYDKELVRTIKRVRRYTMTTSPRIAALCDGVEYVVRNRISGDFVECGVWKGGSMMAVALTLMRVGATDRRLHLFDTYSGMTSPGQEDVPSPYDGYSPRKRWQRKNKAGDEWNGRSLQEVRSAMEGTGYPSGQIHLVPGRVEDTLPSEAPEQIALLRLDTDWYQSTKHELETLYPRLSIGGVLIIDDYGHYEGARRAVDQYFQHRDHRPMMARIDYTGRLLVKQGPVTPSET